MSFTVLQKKGLSRAQVEAEIAETIAGARMPWVETYDPKIGAGSSPLTANAVLYFRIRFHFETPVMGLKFLVTTTGGNCRVGVFDSADGGVTLNPVVISASTPVAAATAIQKVPFTTIFTPDLGKDYWLAFGTDGTAQFWRSTAPSSTLNMEDAAAVSRLASYAMDAPVTPNVGAGVTVWLRTY